MPEPSVLAPLVVFGAMSLAIIVLLWRVGSMAGSLRQQTQYRRGAMDIARRAETSLGELATVVDEMRRRKLTPELGEASLAASSEAVARYAEEAESIVATGPQVVSKVRLVEDLQRAERAIELIEHGRALLVQGGHERITEGETSVKRGYLNLLHAREAIRARIEEIAAEAAPPAPAPLFGRRRAH